MSGQQFVSGGQNVMYVMGVPMIHPVHCACSAFSQNHIDYDGIHNDSHRNPCLLFDKGCDHRSNEEENPHRNIFDYMMYHLNIDRKMYVTKDYFAI